MPKPVLSDSLFNADDVATAVLAEANLQIANSDLGVADITSSFVRNSNWSSYRYDKVFKFMGFVFFSLGAVKTSTPSDLEVIWTISDSALHPSDQYHTNSITYQGDFSNLIEIKTNGEIPVRDPVQGSGSDASFRVLINGWYRI